MFAMYMIIFLLCQITEACITAVIWYRTGQTLHLFSGHSSTPLLSLNTLYSKMTTIWKLYNHSIHFIFRFHCIR